MTVCVYAGEALARYSLGDNHPFGPARHDYFLQHLVDTDPGISSCLRSPVQATQAKIELFHSHDYVELVKRFSVSGEGFLDQGDTPVFKGMYEAAATVVGTTLAAIDDIMSGDCQRAFVPIAGLHHGRRDAAAGFCVFNDCGVAIEHLRQQYGLERILYVDIDAHHGDGVYYSFEADADLRIVDIHEDGRYLYPGTGFADETGTGAAAGTKRNYPLPRGSGDTDFVNTWEQSLSFMHEAQPRFVLLQCGADSLADDPITHLRYSEKAHQRATRDLCRIADQYANGRIAAMGGGGYNLDNLARAWCAVVRELGR